MGTSNSNKGTGGKGTPLIPTWLEEIGSTSDVINTDQSISSDITVTLPQNRPVLQVLPPIPQAGDKNRFTAPRSNFSSFVNSGGSKRGSLGRAISGYISRSAGGSKRAARGMGSSRTAGARLVGFLSEAISKGVEEALKTLKLEELAGSPIEEIFIGLTEYICPEGGTVDAGIAREAFIATISELASNGITDLGSLNTNQMQTVFELFGTHAIEARLYNEIGTNAISFPNDVSVANVIQQQLRDFVRNAVSDSLTEMRSDLIKVTPNLALKFVDGIYERAFEIMIALSEKELEK